MPAYFRRADLSTADAFLNREGRDGTVIEYYQLALLRDELLERRTAGERNGIVKQRLEHLKNQQVKKVRKIFSITADRPSNSTQTMPLDIPYMTNITRSLGLSARRFDTDEIKRFLYQLVSLDDNLRISKDMTVREQVLQRQISFEPEAMKIGPFYVKVLSLKHLPDMTSAFKLAYILDFVLNEYLLHLSFQISDQNKERAAISLKKRLAVSSMNREKHLPNEAAQVKFNEATELSTLIAAENVKIGVLTSHIVVWDASKSGLQSKAEWIQDKLKGAGYFYNEEYLFHDREFFRLLPGHSIFSNRGIKVLTSNFTESLPISKSASGDVEEKTPFYLRNRFGELYAFDPFSPKRNNFNGMVLGASGSGKSVTMNMLIAHAMKPRIEAEGGKIFIIDFAGAEKSSYLKMAKLFGGQFLPIDASGKITINPFPPKSAVLEGDRWNTQALTTLNVILDLILANRGEGMESDLFRGIISRAIMEMYQAIENPTLKDVLKFIHDDDKEKADLLKKLLSGFLASPESKLISGTGSLEYTNEPFVIFDLQGISSLPPKMQELITFITIGEAKKAAFNTPGAKFIIFDECAQLIRDPRMVSLIDEMYSTARKYRTSVWTITQNFLSFKESALSSKIKINTTTTLFLSHASDEEAKRLVASDFGLSEQEKDAFNRLQTRKGEYSLALIRTITAAGDESEVVRIELSPLDYWLATSDDKDNQTLSEIMKRENCSIIRACAIAAKVA